MSAFDEITGLGEIIDDDGRKWAFHCIEIADGTRSIAVGTEVRFGVLARLGRYEAGAVTPG